MEETKYDDNLCDYVFRCYKCFWDKLKAQPEPESFRLSFYDVLGFNEFFDEGEIIDEEVNKAVATPEVKLKNADTLKDATPESVE